MKILQEFHVRTLHELKILWTKKVGNSYKVYMLHNPFSGKQEVIHYVQGVSEAFKLFFDDVLMLIIAVKTNCCARAFINSNQDNLTAWSKVHDWHR